MDARLGAVESPYNYYIPGGHAEPQNFKLYIIT